MRKVRPAVHLLPALLCAASLCACATTPEAPTPKPEPETSVSASKGAERVRGLNLDGLSDAAKDIETNTNTQVGVAVYDGETDVYAGSVGVMPAWSTIKVPIAVAAQEYCEYDDETLQDLTSASIEWSDNDSATSLWTCIGPDEEASRIVGEEISKGGMSVEVEPYFGTTPWPVPAQARYAHHLGSLPDNHPVITEMHKIDPEHSYGLGTIDGLPFKGGWSDADDGSWHSRQLGFTTVDDKIYGIAIAARSVDGSEADCQEALGEIAGFLGDALKQSKQSK